MSAQFQLRGGSFNRKTSPANRVFVADFCCSINSHKYSGAVRSIKALKVKNNILPSIFSITLGAHTHVCSHSDSHNSWVQQYGFMPDKGLYYGCLWKGLLRKMSLYSKAFDTVKHQLLMDLLKSLDVDHAEIWLLISLY